MNGFGLLRRRSRKKRGFSGIERRDMILSEIACKRPIGREYHDGSSARWPGEAVMTELWTFEKQRLYDTSGVEILYAALTRPGVDRLRALCAAAAVILP